MSRTSGPANRRTVDSDAAALLKEEFVVLFQFIVQSWLSLMGEALSMRQFVSLRRLAEKEQLLAGRRQKEWIKTEQFKNQDLRVRLADRIAQSKAEIESELARDKKKKWGRSSMCTSDELVLIHASSDVALRNVKKALESNRLPGIGLWDKNFEAVLGVSRMVWWCLFPIAQPRW